MRCPSEPDLDELLRGADLAASDSDRDAAYRLLTRAAQSLECYPERFRDVGDRLERVGFPEEASRVRKLEEGWFGVAVGFELPLGFARDAAQRGDRRVALELLEEAASQADERWLRLRLADAFLDLGEIDRFRNELDAARGLGWNDAALLDVIGRRIRKIGDLPMAEASYRAALMLQDDGLVRVQLARVLHESGRTDEAEELIERTLRSGVRRRDPCWLRQALWELVELRNEQGREADALLILTRLARVGPEHDEHYWCQLRVGEQLLRLGRGVEARQALAYVRDSSDVDLRARVDRLLVGLDSFASVERQS